MKISIITPTFNSEAAIINNVNSILSQTYSNFEHILIDNESNDSTLNLAKNEYNRKNSIEKLRIIREKDNGIAEAFNKGIKLADGEIIGILNSDDKYYDETVFGKVIEAFKDDNILYVHGNIFFNDARYGSNIRKPLMCPITRALPFNHPTMFFRKEVYLDYGLYDTDYKYSMDFEFICRLIKRVDDFYQKGAYLKGDPVVVMAAGGVSWANEPASITETKRALKQHGFWNLDAQKNYAFRVCRTKTKSILKHLKADNVVKLWRKIKWRN